MCDCVACTHGIGCGLAGVNMNAVAAGFADLVDDRCDNDLDGCDYSREESDGDLNDDSDEGIREDNSNDTDTRGIGWRME